MFTTLVSELDPLKVPVAPLEPPVKVSSTVNDPKVVHRKLLRIVAVTVSV